MSHDISKQADAMRDSRNWPSHIAILIPSYCGVHSLKKLLPTLCTVVPSSQILVVNDGPADGTEDVCRDAGVSVITHGVNKGKGCALQTGFAQLIQERFPWIITLDADGQHALDDLPHFCAAIESHSQCAMIIGARQFSPRFMPLPRIISNTCTSAFLSLLTGMRIKDSQCGYRAYSTTFLSGIHCKAQHFEMETEIILRAWYHQQVVTFIPVQTLYCSDTSHISHLIDTLRWLRTVVFLWAGMRLKR